MDKLIVSSLTLMPYAYFVSQFCSEYTKITSLGHLRLVVRIVPVY